MYQPQYNASNNNPPSSGIGIKFLLIVNLIFLVHTVLPQAYLILPNAIDRHEKNRDSGPYVIAPFSLSSLLFQLGGFNFGSHRGGILTTSHYAFAVPLLLELPSLLNNLAMLYITIMLLFALLNGGTNESLISYSRTYMFINLCNPDLILKLCYMFFELVNKAPGLGLFVLWWLIALGWCLINGLVAMSYYKSLSQGPMLPMQGQFVVGAVPTVVAVIGGEQQSLGYSMRGGN